MKKASYPFSFAAVAFALIAFVLPCHSSAFAGKPTTLPNDGDNLHPNVSFAKSAINAVDYESKTASFIPELFVPNDEADASIFISNDTLSYIQFATKHLFRIASDTLKYIGYENRSGDFLLSPAADAMSLDQNHPGSLETAWKGRLTLHGRTFFKNAEGVSSASIEKGWIIAGDADTIRNATLARWDLLMSYADSNITSQNIPDSVAAENISDLELPIDRVLSERLLTRREMWYSDDARYPVLQRSRVFRLKYDGSETCDTTLLSSFASYYPAAYQYSDTGEQPEKRAPGSDSSNGYTEDNTIPGVEISEASAHGENISVTLSSESGNQELKLTLYTDSGIRLSETMRVRASVIPQTCTIPIPSGVSGVVILLIESDTGSASRKIIIF